MWPRQTWLLPALLALVLGACGNPAGMATRKGPGVSTERQDAARVNTDLGQQYLRQGRLELALEKLQRALEFDPAYVDAHTVIAVLYEQIGDLPQAEQHYRRAAQLKPKGGAELNNYGAFLCKTRRFAEAQEHFNRALADPFYQTPAVAMTNFGSCLLKAGQNEEAERMLREALARSPDNAEALLLLADVSYRKGEFFNARGFLQRFEALAAPQPESLMLGRNIEIKLGDARGAREYTRRLLEAFPQSPEAESLNVRIERDEQAQEPVPQDRQ